MSAVTLAVSFGCHVAAAAAFKSTLFGNATPRRCFKTLGEPRREEKKKIRGSCCEEPLADTSQRWRLCHLLEWERCSKPRLLGNGAGGGDGGSGGTLHS